MKFFNAIILASLLTPSVVLAEGTSVSASSSAQKKDKVEWPVAEVVPSMPTIYSIQARILKGGAPVYETKLQTVAGRPVSIGEYWAEPTNGGVPLDYDKFEKGYLQTFDCDEYGASGMIRCRLKGTVREFLPVRFEPGGSAGEIHSQLWDQTVIVGSGDKTVLTVGKYQFEMTVKAL